MYCLTVEYIRPRGHPFRTIDPITSPPTSTLCTLNPEKLSCNHIHQAYSPGCRVLRISKRPEPVNLVHCSSCNRHEPFCYSRRHRPTPKNTSRGNPGCAVEPKTPTGSEATLARGEGPQLSIELLVHGACPSRGYPLRRAPTRISQDLARFRILR
jgi:hypothetical protein